jgi:uncharacterized protein (DUF433 family)
MVAPNYQFIGRGVYSLREAERLTGIPRVRIRRWTRGYSFRYRGGRVFSPPVLASAFQGLDDVGGIDFADLIEVRFLEAFRKKGLAWKTIRLAAAKARQILEREHPFLTRRFRTDGHAVLMEIGEESGNKVLLNLVTDQYEVRQLIERFLVEGLEFRDDEVVRWYPMGAGKRVVVDPARSFGAPITIEGVPTRVLAATYKAERSIQAVADWYRVSSLSVRHAVAFERR